MGAQVRPLQTGIGLETYGWREILRMRIGSRSTSSPIPCPILFVAWSGEKYVLQVCPRGETAETAKPRKLL